MQVVLEEICVALHATGVRFNALGDSPRTLKDEYGFLFPALTRTELAHLAFDLAKRLSDADVSDVGNVDISALKDVPRRLQSLCSDTIPNINGQAQAVYAYTESLRILEKALEPFLIFSDSENVKVSSAQLLARIKASTKRLDRIEKNQDGVEDRVERINRAYEAAGKLPITLQQLDDARSELEDVREKIDKFYDDAAKGQGKIEDNVKESFTSLEILHGRVIEAEKLIQKCEAAYQITTTKGLAGAFDQRARRLNYSIIACVIGLLLALGVGGYFGSKRIEFLEQIASNGHPEWGLILMHVALSVLSVGGPLWFAWLATKQIGQRFRLAEDYAFKASVAKAYEGYRKEAANLDESFSSRLFSSALTRLEEAPLRFVEQDSHGSPWHEAMRSASLQKAFATVPNFYDQVLELAKKSMDTAAAIATKAGGKDGQSSPSVPTKPAE